MTTSVRLVETDEEISRCLPVLRELRPKFVEVAELLAALRLLRAEGAGLAALEQNGEVATVAVFRLQHMLVSGRTMYVDDLVTAERFRSRGHGKAMLAWLIDHAKSHGCETFSLDSGTFRQEAHAFYFREGLRITSFHFARPL